MKGHAPTPTLLALLGVSHFDKKALGAYVTPMPMASYTIKKWPTLKKGREGKDHQTSKGNHLHIGIWVNDIIGNKNWDVSYNY